MAVKQSPSKMIFPEDEVNTRALIVHRCVRARTPCDASASLLRERTCLTFYQGWRDQMEPGFQPGRVWLGHDQEALYVLADLTDRRIYSPATDFNDARRKQGDFFEILLRPCGQSSYYELHVTPTGCLSQFRFNDFQHVACLGQRYPGQDLAKYLQYERPVFDAKVQVDVRQGGWSVLAVIRLRELVDQMPRGQTHARRRWCAAFCRWDWDSATQSAISSSTAPFLEYDYHDHRVWHRLVLDREPIGQHAADKRITT